MEVSQMGEWGIQESMGWQEKKECELKWVQKTEAESDAWLSEWVNGGGSEIGGGERVQEREWMRAAELHERVHE